MTEKEFDDAIDSKYKEIDALSKKIEKLNSDQKKLYDEVLSLQRDRAKLLNNELAKK